MNTELLVSGPVQSVRFLADFAGLQALSDPFEESGLVASLAWETSPDSLPNSQTAHSSSQAANKSKPNVAARACMVGWMDRSLEAHAVVVHPHLCSEFFLRVVLRRRRWGARGCDRLKPMLLAGLGATRGCDRSGLPGSPARTGAAQATLR